MYVELDHVHTSNKGETAATKKKTNRIFPPQSLKLSKLCKKGDFLVFSKWPKRLLQQKCNNEGGIIATRHCNHTYHLHTSSHFC